jgi:hypothetical protein
VNKETPTKAWLERFHDINRSAIFLGRDVIDSRQLKESAPIVRQSGFARVLLVREFVPESAKKVTPQFTRRAIERPAKKVSLSRAGRESEKSWPTVVHDE